MRAQFSNLVIKVDLLTPDKQFSFSFFLHSRRLSPKKC